MVNESGKDGKDGQQGIAGTQGTPGVDGAPGRDGAPGTNGSNGTDGAQGIPGPQGETGATGPSGPTGPGAPVNPYTIMEMVNPCGDAPGVIDEVFIRIATGQLIVLFAQNNHGDYPRLAVLVPGAYSTSDGDNCTFTLNSNNQVVNESHHY